ncbi:MAG TPA: hypothetical protein VHW01_08440 [Polyangiaceae bacterium]|nr:hypothetical protein [Polyangiaceae bacterium]
MTRNSVRILAARRSSALVFALLAAACSGKGRDGSCTDGAICGGDPSGSWDVVGSCQYAADTIDQQFSPREQIQTPQPPVLTDSPVAATTNGDWCSRLYYSPTDVDPMHPNSKVLVVDLPHPAPPLAGGQISFNNASGSTPANYQVSLSFATSSSTHFTVQCVQFGGASPSCGDLATNLQQFYVSKAGVNAQGMMQAPSFANIACNAASDGGCDCSYDYKVTLTDVGTWQGLGNVISEAGDPGAYLYNGQPAAASQEPTKALLASFCRAGNTLSLSGYDGSFISGAPGLRVLSLSEHQ